MSGTFFMMMAAAGAKKPYSREVQYLQSSNACLVNSGIVPDAETELRFKYEFVGFGDNSGAMICGQTATYGTRANMLGVGPLQAAGRLYTTFGTYSRYTSVDHGGEDLRVYRGGVWNTGDGTQYRAPIGEGLVQSITTGQPLYVFAENYGGTMYRAGRIKLHYLKISNNGILQRDFVPVLDKSDVPCLYDKVSGTLFYNLGTGSFTYE